MRPFPLLAVLVSLPALAAQGWITEEVTFDDGPDGSGLPGDGFERVRSLEQPLGSNWQMAFQGGAHRSSITQGRYGRAAVFPGAGSISIAQLNRPDDDFRFLIWVKADAPAGQIFHADGSLSIELQAGQVIVVDEASGVQYPTGRSIPGDGAFHHLWIEYQALTLTVDVDFGVRTPIAFGTMAPWTAGSIGTGFKGMLDELLVTQFEIWGLEDYVLDRRPTACGAPGLQCSERTFAATPRGWPFPVPVRMKVVREPSLCNAINKCPVLFIVSGGGMCQDDYPGVHDVTTYTAAGFVVVAVDPYCEYGPPWFQVPHQTSLLVEAKKRIFADPTVRSWLLATDEGDYLATGCSHGAQSAASWLLAEADHPKRAFTRSANFAAHCTYHQVPCRGAQVNLDTNICGLPSPHDDADPKVRCIDDQWGMIQYVDAAVVHSRELGAIWGGQGTAPIEGVCPGHCVESDEGNDVGGQLIRDKWKSLEEPSHESGWFWEWNTKPCVHCPWDADVATCSACFLKHGRGAMKDRCPSCLAKYQGPRTLTCPPQLQSQGDAGVPPVDAGVPPVDAGVSPVDAGVRLEGLKAGAGCSTAPGGFMAALLALLGLTVGRRVRSSAAARPRPRASRA